MSDRPIVVLCSVIECVEPPRRQPRRIFSHNEYRCGVYFDRSFALNQIRKLLRLENYRSTYHVLGHWSGTAVGLSDVIRDSQAAIMIELVLQYAPWDDTGRNTGRIAERRIHPVSTAYPVSVASPPKTYLELLVGGAIPLECADEGFPLFEYLELTSLE